MPAHGDWRRCPIVKPALPQIASIVLPVAVNKFGKTVGFHLFQTFPGRETLVIPPV